MHVVDGVASGRCGWSLAAMVLCLLVASSQVCAQARTEPADELARLLEREPAGRKAVPTAEQLREAGRLVDETLTGRRRSAGELLELAEQTTDSPAGRFVLLERAQAAALQDGDVSTATVALSRLVSNYDVAVTKAVTAFVASAGDSSGSKVGAAATIDLVLKTSHRLEFARTVSSVPALLDAATVVAARIPDESARSAASERLRQAEDFNSRSAAVETLLTRAATGKLDREQAALVLDHRCFSLEDWPIAARFAGTTGDAMLDKLLSIEVSPRPDPKTLGDGWWEYAESTPGARAWASRRRAASWYLLARPNVTGLTAKVLDSRVSAASALVDVGFPMSHAGPVAPATPISTPPADTTRPGNVFILIDCSGSMMASVPMVIKEAGMVLERLDPPARFNLTLVREGTTVPFAATFQSATEEQKQRAREYLKQVVAAGTNGDFRAILADTLTRRPSRVVIFTDGDFGQEVGVLGPKLLPLLKRPGVRFEFVFPKQRTRLGATASPALQWREFFTTHQLPNVTLREFGDL